MTYRAANLQSCILYIYSTNICTEYFKHGVCSLFFFLQNAVCFIILTCLVSVLFTFYIQGVLNLLYTGCAKIKKNNSSAKRLNKIRVNFRLQFRVMCQAVSSRPFTAKDWILTQVTWVRYLVDQVTMGSV